MSGLGDQARSARHVLSTQGPGALARRVVRDAGRRLGASDLDFPLLPGDIADSNSLVLRRPEPVTEDRPLQIGWIITPPSHGSGGHTTLFRMVAALEAAGHECTLVLYDRFGGDPRERTRVIRTGWPWVGAAVRDIDDGLADLDAIVATSWQTAHVLARRSAALPCQRLYFAQDFEPFFYPRGSEYALAEDTYRFGFRTIAVGHMVADLVASTAGTDVAVAEFGCDTDVYGLTSNDDRRGIAFYAKPDNPRRGFQLATLALGELHRRRPEIEIHLYGDTSASVPFPVTRHGNLAPTDLAALYNRCIAGVAMSFTNISLIAEELLACGTIPVVNDDPYTRADLPNPHVRWAAPTPAAITAALLDEIDAEDRPGRAASAAASVRHDGWAPAARTTVEVLESTTRGALR